MIVIDTSVALKWFLTEEEKDVKTANILLANHLRKKEEIMIPDLFFYEAVNALTTKTSLPQSATTKLIKKLYCYNLKIYYPTLDDLLQTSKLAKKHHSSVYDMLYAVVAKKHKTTLVTADGKFVEKTRFSHVIHLKDVRAKSAT